jgi:Domain of unknown function (DUF222)/HNH endonuclease
MISTSAAMSNQERTERLEVLFRSKAAIEGEIAVHLGEVERSQSFRDEGGTSTESWVAERFGVATSTARSLTLLGEKAWDLPHLIGAVCAGDVSLDKVKVLAEVATAESDEELCEEAKKRSLRDLTNIARTTPTRRSTNPAALTAAEQHVRRFVRFNDQFRTVTAQLPAESYAEAKACLEARAKAVPADDGAPWDHRLCDGFMGLMRSSTSGGSDQAMTPSSHMVVVHVPLQALVGEASAGHGGTRESTELAGELERDGLICTEVVQRIACDATIAVAVDDDVGHTMYEGRAQRFPTGVQRREVRRRDRHCRFPGCSHVTFANVHHVVPWKPGGRTDLPNLAFLCEYHHHLVHSKGWSMTGNANEELTIVGPTGRVMTSRPSPLWTRVTDRRRV